METLIDEMTLAALDRGAAKRMLSNAFSSKGFGCAHKHEYWSGVEKDFDYVLFSVHLYEYCCPDCNKSYWLAWKPESV